MKKLLLGGSPCTHWSIAQTKNRETKAEGIGWELFLNYVIAKEKFQPDYFLYENNWSASKDIKGQIQKSLGCELMRINSSLVSAQSRDRFYVFNWDVEQPKDRQIYLSDILESGSDVLNKERGYCLTASYGKASLRDTLRKSQNTMVDMPVRVGTVENNASNQTQNDSKQYRVYAPYGKSVTLCGQGGGIGAKTGLYAIPYNEVSYDLINGADIVVTNGKIRQSDCRGTKQGKYIYLPCCKKSNTLSAGQSHNEKVLSKIDANKTDYKNIYEVTNSTIIINGKPFSVNLEDGQYIIRKLTPIECERLQTMPDNYTASVSNTQRYKCLGNGWTAEVIIHILDGVLKDVPRDEKIVVLSMYDGIATGRYCLDKMGFKNVEYHAYEIDKYAIKVAISNYPDIIQHGDAFDIRKEDWKI